MKYRVIGWCSASCPTTTNYSFAIYNTIIDEIRAQGYLFCGDEHLSADWGVPVLNNGIAYFFAPNDWANLMAKALRDDDQGATARYAHSSVPSTRHPAPYVDRAAIRPRIELREMVPLMLREQQFELYARAGELPLYADTDGDQIEQLRHLDAGDQLHLACGDRRIVRKVAYANMGYRPDEADQLRFYTEYANDPNRDVVQATADWWDTLPLCLTIGFGPIRN